MTTAFAPSRPLRYVVSLGHHLAANSLSSEACVVEELDQGGLTQLVMHASSSQNQTVQRPTPFRRAATLTRRGADEGSRKSEALLPRSIASFQPACAKALSRALIFHACWLCRPAWASNQDSQEENSFASAELISASPLSTLPATLTWRNLASASVIVVACSVVFAAQWSHTKLAKDIAIACLRCLVQLQLIGGLVLNQYLIVSQTHVSLVLLWIFVIGILAAVEAKSRIEHTYPHMTKHLCIALLTGAGAVMGAAALSQAFGELRPWFAPRTWIPVSGMLFGNALTACGLAMSTWTREFITRRSSVEWRLCRGASWKEALSAPLRLSFTSALTPVVNALSVTGLVQLPGMMTGQILAGQSPYQAAAYQVIIFFLIASISLLSVQTALCLALRATVDTEFDRLLPAETVSASSQKSRSMAMSESASFLEHASPDHVESGRAISISTPRRADGSVAPFEGQRPVLSIHNLLVERTGARVSLDLYRSEWVAIKGPSGAGKSQVLRTIAGLENLDRSLIVLNGIKMEKMSMPEWRRRVALVLQDRPSIEGTPQQFYDEVRDYGVSGTQNGSYLDPGSFLRSWGSSSTLLDQPWTSLSGGEAQRASLAIALSLQPDVILLDESTNALDDQLSIRVENTIKNMGIPVLIVSHSTSQLDRVCTSVLENGH